MVVSETARHHSGPASGEASSSHNGECHTPPSPRPFHALAFAALLLFSRAPHAQVVADPSAPGNQRPTILQTANGLPQINIQTPSGAGVSRNTYSQFDVQSNGVILNNSRTNTNTQLAGQISANPWLATGEARIILNEVRSSNPIHLRCVPAGQRLRHARAQCRQSARGPSQGREIGARVGPASGI